MSDIHAQYDSFRKMERKIRFDRSNDKLIIIGDVLDRGRGSEGIDLLRYIKAGMEEGCMELIAGNHVVFAMWYLQGILEGHTWEAYGGGDTYETVLGMDESEKTELLSFLEELPFYRETDSPFYGKTILTHTGFDCERYVYRADGKIDVAKSIERAVKENLRFIVGSDIHDIPVSDKKLLDRYIIVGHIPVFRLAGPGECHIYRTGYYMDIDTGACFKGGRLSCYCVDTDEEFYV
ncbi:MAG: metallophosphoesterase [Lachnospiraceae bacterium]|nr:metallophosphoesterase [Lachnospiraceae bacterium]